MVVGPLLLRGHDLGRGHRPDPGLSQYFLLFGLPPIGRHCCCLLLSVFRPPGKSFYTLPRTGVLAPWLAGALLHSPLLERCLLL